VPQALVIFYKERDGRVPVLEWLQQLKKSDPKGFANCVARIKQLQENGYELRRPASDYLRDGIRELRANHRNVQYRMLYFFQGENIVIIVNSLIKKSSEVPERDIEKAIEGKENFESDPINHSYSGGLEDEENN